MKMSFKFKKILVIMIVVIIPLLAAALIGLYSYNRYQDDYFFEYMNNIEEETEAKVENYLKYTNVLFEEDPFYYEDVKKDNELVLTVAVYRGIKSESEEEKTLFYYFVVYNIDYEKLIEIEDPTGEKKLIYNDLPGIYLAITDNENTENEQLELLGAIDTTFYINDYLSSPEEDIKGKELNSRFVKWFAYERDEDFSKDLYFEIIVSENPEEDLSPGIITSFNLEVANEEDDIDTTNFTLGYDNNIHKAGYFGYVFKKRIWWQALIAFALVGIISYSFYAVWTVEEEHEKKKRL